MIGQAYLDRMASDAEALALAMGRGEAVSLIDTHAKLRALVKRLEELDHAQTERLIAAMGADKLRIGDRMQVKRVFVVQHVLDRAKLIITLGPDLTRWEKEVEYNQLRFEATP